MENKPIFEPSSIEAADWILNFSIFEMLALLPE